MHHVAATASGQTLVKPLLPAYARYLREEVYPRLQPLSDSEYLNGPAGILNTLARFSYVIDGGRIFWCVEWRPGLLAIDLTPGGMRWAARRSPDPEFGGRRAASSELQRYDAWQRAWQSEHREQPPQYGLIFDAWDDTVAQSFSAWQAASEAQHRIFRDALDALNTLTATLLHSPRSCERYMEMCRHSFFWNMQWNDFD